MDGTAYLDLPGLMWDQTTGIAQIGSFPVGSRLSFFLAGWQQITSDQFVLQVVPPFCEGSAFGSLPCGDPTLCRLSYK